MSTNPVSALVCMSAFKGTLTNEEACKAVADGLSVLNIPFQILPVGDGGRGTVTAVQSCLGGEFETFQVSGPLTKQVSARVLCIPNKEFPHSLYVESSETCGHYLLNAEERDAMRASSYGLGELLKLALERWKNSVKKVFVGLGDSAISDAGMGMLSALGFQFYDEGGHVLWGNGNGLRSVASMKPSPSPLLKSTKFIVLCDVMNPLCGPQGSARVFAPQKGATPEQVKLLEQGMENFAAFVQKSTGRAMRTTPMSGSAGGLASGFLAFLNADLVHGATFLLDWINFDRLIDEHGFVITGEGKTDQQTLNGKAPFACVERAAKLGKKSLIFSGMLGSGYEAILNTGGTVACFAVGDAPNPKQALRTKVAEALADPALIEQLKFEPPTES